MGGFSLIHWLVLGLVVLLLFGRGRFSDMMGDVAKGLKSFKKGMSEDDEQQQQQSQAVPPRLQNQPPLEPNRAAELQPMKDDRPAV